MTNISAASTVSTVEWCVHVGGGWDAIGSWHADGWSFVFGVWSAWDNGGLWNHGGVCFLNVSGHWFHGVCRFWSIGGERGGWSGTNDWGRNGLWNHCCDRSVGGNWDWSAVIAWGTVSCWSAISTGTGGASATGWVSSAHLRVVRKDWF